MTCCTVGHCAAGWPAKKAAIAFLAQSLRSLVTTEWPVKGTATSWAPGMRAATLAASSRGVRRSKPPERMSVGTAGSGVGGAGGGLASGHATHTGIDSLRSATW